MCAAALKSFLAALAGVCWCAAQLHQEGHCQVCDADCCQMLLVLRHCHSLKPLAHMRRYHALWPAKDSACTIAWLVLPAAGQEQMSVQLLGSGSLPQ